MYKFTHKTDSASVQPQPDRQSGSTSRIKLLSYVNSKSFNVGAGLFMASLWGVFAYRHVMAFLTFNDWTYLVIAGSETIIAAFFIFRSAPATVSHDPFDWVFGVAGTFTPLLFIPASWGILPGAKYLIAIGVVLQILGLISLNRSLAMVAAKRTIKTSGMYRLVRHPLYAAYFFVFTGYSLANTTIWNIVIYSISMGLLLSRIQREERHLLTDPIYADYAQRVRWRVLPYAY